MNRLHREWWLLLSSLVLLQLRTARCTTCPSPDTILPCRCSSAGTDAQIWCSYSSLPSVMGALQQLRTTLQLPIDEMILEGNNLPSLPGRNFDGLKIARLMLRDNGLERVTSNWLASLENVIQELFVVEPRLRTLPEDILENLRRLEAVTLQAGFMKRTPKFSGLSKLRYVQLKSPALMDLTPDNFEHLPSLEELNIVGSPLLTKLDAGLLQNLHKLTLINVSNCSLTWLHPKTFIGLLSVREVALGWNRLSDAGVVGRACRDLQNLQILRLDNNFIDRLIEGSFVDLPSLRELYLSGNMISEIHGGAFRNTPSLKILDLSKNVLRRVNAAAFLYPSGSSLEELWLIDNQLAQVNELKALLSSLPRLKFIDMSRNQMEELPFDVFRGHPTLERLHLNENKIRRLPKKAFSGMAALRELRLRNNSISEFPDGATWNLPSLKGLDLAQNKFRRLDARLMTYLPSLRTLDLSENFIDTVLPDSFVGNLELETINLSKNFITSFHTLTFSHLPKLYELDTSWNRLREVISGLPRDIEYLRLGQNQIFTLPAPPTSLELPHLRLFDLSGNALQVLQSDTFQSMSRLQWLYLNDNLLQSLQKGALNGLSRLEVINIRNNRIRELDNDYLKGLKGLKEINLQGNYLEVLNTGILGYSPKLETVRLGNNKITEVQPGAFSNARELQELNLTHNVLESFPEALQGLKMLRSLDISHNNVRSVQPFLLESLPSLTELRVSNNKLYNLSPNSFSDLQKLEYLDLNNNELENIATRAIVSLPNLIALQIGGNRLTTLSPETFVDLPELQSVDLHSNHLQDISEHAFVNVPHLALLNISHNLITDVEKAGVRELRSLEILDLSDNKVAWIEGRSFTGMDWLVELKMDNNMICHIHGAPFNDLPRLRVLTIRHNRMTTVTENVFQKLRENIAVFDIDGNPLSCSCRMLWLQAWLQDTASVGPRCSDGTLFRDARLSRTDCAHSRVVEPSVPGCDEHSLRGPVVEALQLGSPVNNQTHQSLINHHHHSLNSHPQQSMIVKVPDGQDPDYVYDEYVEYEEMNTTDPPPTLIPVEVTASEMKLSPHLVTGDTPTLYAAQTPPTLNLTNAGLGYNDLKKAQLSHQATTPSPSAYNGLTFFGIPLPNLSLGNIWRGRSTESAPYNRASVKPVIPSGRNRAQNFVTPTPDASPLPAELLETFPQVSTITPERLSTYRPINPPDIESGFLPMVPNSVGISTTEDLLPRVSSSDETVEPSPTDREPSSNLPLEHRSYDEHSKAQWDIPRQTNAGRIEPVVSPSKESLLEPTERTQEQHFLETNAAGEDSVDASQDQPNSSTRSRHTSDDRFENEITTKTVSILESPPAVNNQLLHSNGNSWYYQNYNSNMKPYVERTGRSSAFRLTPLVVIIVTSLVYTFT